uniref:Uncharacterized protein n=1 Tax=Rhipicephalus microplus TaxID=6941 RepID=A0A6G5A1Z8_RHIMP
MGCMGISPSYFSVIFLSHSTLSFCFTASCISLSRWFAKESADLLDCLLVSVGNPLVLVMCSVLCACTSTFFEPIMLYSSCAQIPETWVLPEGSDALGTCAMGTR